MKLSSRPGLTRASTPYPSVYRHGMDRRIKSGDDDIYEFETLGRGRLYRVRAPQSVRAISSTR